jgi:hypothetical protein
MDFKMAETNLRVLKVSRKKPRRGDIFAMQPPDGKFLFGRVVDTEAVIGPMVGCILIYIYDVRSDTKESLDHVKLLPRSLLVPPIMTNRLPWSRGYFETLTNRELERGEVLERHCFRASGGRYYDERGGELEGPTEPVGVRALKSYRTIDDAVSQALGIPFAPD